MRQPRRLSIRALSVAWLALAGIVLCCLLAELGLRLDYEASRRASERYVAGNVFFAHAGQLHAASQSLWLKPWIKYRPGAHAEIVAGDERFTIEINSRGFRTPEFALPKPPGLVRVACIGGSTTVAGRTNGDTYPAQLEAMLRERHPGLQIEVLNLGVSGTTSAYWHDRLDRVFAFDPDVIVEYEGINDIFWRHLGRYAAEHPLRRFAYRSLLLERLFPFPADEFEPYLRETLETLGSTADRCRERRVGLLLATFAGPDPRRMTAEFRRHLDYHMTFWTGSLPMRSYATYADILERYNRLLVGFLYLRRMPHVLVHEQLDDPALFIDQCHFTPDGIRRLAQALLPTVDLLVMDTPGYRRWREQPVRRAAAVPRRDQ